MSAERVVRAMTALSGEQGTNCHGAQGIHVRRAVAQDCDAIAAVLAAAFAEYAPLYTPAGLAATTPTSDMLRNRLDEGPVWVAERDPDAAIVGTVAAAPREHGLYVRSMAVLPDARGQHIGAALFAAVERFAAEQGITQLYLSTTPFLTRAIRLYERLGFQRSDHGPRDLHGTPLFTMVKVLTLPK